MACEDHDLQSYRMTALRVTVDGGTKAAGTTSLWARAILKWQCVGVIGGFGSWMAQFAGVDVVMAAADRDLVGLGLCRRLITGKRVIVHWFCAD